MSKTAKTLNEVRNRKAANEVCATMQDATLRILAARIIAGIYF